MPPSRPYAELRAASAFSFLDGATLPEDLIGTAVQRELPAMALVDRNGVYGAPRFYTAAKKCGGHPIGRASGSFDLGQQFDRRLESRARSHISGR